MAHVEHLVDVDRWMTEHNDDAPLPGRVLVVAACAGCEHGRRLALPPGRWTVAHNHGQPWDARPYSPTGGRPPADTRLTILGRIPTL